MHVAAHTKEKDKKITRDHFCLQADTGTLQANLI